MLQPAAQLAQRIWSRSRRVSLSIPFHVRGNFDVNVSQCTTAVTTTSGAQAYLTSYTTIAKWLRVKYGYKEQWATVKTRKFPERNDGTSSMSHRCRGRSSGYHAYLTQENANPMLFLTS